ncbi:MAG: methionyl-tRNA formyltransferase [bacterium]|nr:methionyl-tRNA formyltransferase [bacterium]
MKKISLVFFGSQQNSADLLELLVKDERFKVVAVVTQPDRPIGRKKVLTATPVSAVVEKYEIDLLKPERAEKKNLLKDSEGLYESLKKYNFALILTYEYGQLLTEDILGLGKFGGVNIHFSLLPSFRGAAPLPWQILHGEKETGITFSKMGAAFDTGNLLYQEAQEIKNEDTTVELHKRLSKRVLDITMDILQKYIDGELKKISSNYPESYCPRMTREDGYVEYSEFKRSMEGDKLIAIKIERMLRAFNPWPGVYTLVSGKRLKILSGNMEGVKFVPENVQWEGRDAQKWDKAI